MWEVNVLKRIWDVTLTVSDLKAAVHFYERILGLQKKYEFPDYAGFDCGGIEIGLKTWGGLGQPRDGEPCLNFLVDDLEEAYTVLKEKGVNFVREPQDAQWGGRFALFRDRDGNTLQLTQIDWRKYFAACAPR
jgi:catechol 2,3-dioxygenase-like lactoylglutathione lyase family enzyme